MTDPNLDIESLPATAPVRHAPAAPLSPIKGYDPTFPQNAVGHRIIKGSTRFSAGIVLACGFWMPGTPGVEPAAAAAEPAVHIAGTPLGAASELGPKPGVWELHRSGDLGSHLQLRYELSGTATRGIDYQVLQEEIEFLPGHDRTFFTVLPRNDALPEGNERIVLKLVPGAGYTLGSVTEATVGIEDAFFNQFPGVFDAMESSMTPLSPDLTYLDAAIADGVLGIVFAYAATTGDIQKIEFYLDTDRNPDTGDIRAGHAGGFEFRVTAFASLTRDWVLTRLPRTDAEARAGEVQVFPIPRPIGSLPNGLSTISIPLNLIENPSAADLVAYGWVGGAIPGNPTIAAAGDRCPDFGVLDTATRQVVVRRPFPTFLTEIADPAGDQRNSHWDLRAVRVDCVADQVAVSLKLNAPVFRPGVNNVLGLEPRGLIQLDTDRSLATGGITMGDLVPSWGGDAQVFFSMTAGIATPTVLLQFDPSGAPVVFGQDRNDGRWFATGDQLSFVISATALDPFILEQVPIGGGFLEPRTTRLKCSSRMTAIVRLLDTRLIGTADQLGQAGQALDTATGRLLSPLALSLADAVHGIDPAEFGPFLSGIDITDVFAQVVDQHLIVRADLTTLLQTQTGTYLELWLDADSNPATGMRKGNPGQPAIGADAIARVSIFEPSRNDPTRPTASGIFPVYSTVLIDVALGTVRSAEALTQVRTTTQAGQGGGFTVTIPLNLLPAGSPQIALLAVTGQLLGAGDLDIAPTRPLVIPLSRVSQEELRLAVKSRSDGRLAISFRAVAGKTYQVQMSSRLESGVWEDFGAAVIASGEWIEVPIPIVGSEAARFFRVIER